MVFMPAFVKDLLGVTEMSEETAEVSRNTPNPLDLIKHNVESYV
jgi:hypothetical protein